MENQILHSKIYEKPETTPMLIFHGLFGMLDNWGTLGKKFAEDREVHLIDLRNHGRSFHSDIMDYTSMSDDIVNYCNHYQLQKVILLGHSLGGKAVMECSIKHPSLVDKLIVVDMAPKAYPPHHQAVIKALQSVDFSRINDRKEVEEALSAYIQEPGIIQFLMKNVYRTDKEHFDFRFNLKSLTDNYTQLINKPISFGIYKGPALFIAGENSNYILKQDEFYIRQQFPKEKLEVIPKASHWVQADNPVAFYDAVNHFLNV
ncbi:alpha/beta fold hydrolase [Apibacter sp. HY039]|uniref:alpha/beta fold hydrolase n=1 Tax=Apibacter sp. HY039 TaxID=2501476 RepID=UPI000FEB7E28|nr:alpha/beta fold hydrolase [Apibacter sp. HY039]